MRLIIALMLLPFFACNGTSQVSRSAEMTDLKAYDFDQIDKPEAEWKAELSEMEFYVMREKGTERAFSGPYWDNKKAGQYNCRACGLPLFSSETKFKSGTGWPSFYIPLYSNTVDEEEDTTYGMVRTEVLCARCGGHLGHVFNDGPKPTGLRYCINGASLAFEEK